MKQFQDLRMGNGKTNHRERRGRREIRVWDNTVQLRRIVGWVELHFQGG
jgi:hypothetical protein